MQLIDLILHGVAIGFMIAAPVGPVGALCIRLTLSRGRLAGLFAGLGAALADTIFGLIAAFGLGSIESILFDYEITIRIIGVAVMLILSIRILTKVEKPSALDAGAVRNDSIFGTFVTTFVLTLTNPITIIAFTGIFAAAGVVPERSELSLQISLVVAVFVGSALWWMTLTLIAGLLRGRFQPAQMVWINRVTGGLLLCFAVGLLGSVIWPETFSFLNGSAHA